MLLGSVANFHELLKLRVADDMLADAGSVVRIIHIEKEPSRNATILLLEVLNSFDFRSCFDCCAMVSTRDEVTVCALRAD